MTARVIDFDSRHLAALRRRVAAAEEANQDLLAFARGHSGAVAAIHRAVLAALAADGLAHLVHVVEAEWPDMLGLDAVVLALFDDVRLPALEQAGIGFVDRRLVERTLADRGVVMRDVPRGHPLFGPACGLIRAEALVRLEPAGACPAGVLALGQRHAQDFGSRAGSELLRFLGTTLTATLRRWLA